MIGWAIIVRQRLKAVIRDGQVVWAKVTGVRGNRAGRGLMWYIECAWTDPATGRLYQFESQYVSATGVPEDVDAQLPVYIDPHDPAKKYFVDVRPLTGEDPSLASPGAVWLKSMSNRPLNT